MRLSLMLLRAAAVAGLLLPGAGAFAQKAPMLTLPQALQRAVNANPRLTAAERDIGIRTGKSLQARAVPNPDLSVEVENIAGTGQYRGTRSAETTLQLSQLIELGGKREARIAAGVAELDSAHWQRQAVRLEVLSETAVAYVNVLAEQRRIQVLDEQVSALDRLQPLLQRRVEAGASSQPEILRAQVAADLVRVDREKAKAALASAKRELALLMGDSAVRFAGVAGTLSDTRQPPPFRVITDAIEANPQLMRWSAVRALRDAELLTARLKSIPDLRAGVGYRRFQETRDSAMVVGLSLTVPLWDQNQGDILASRHSLEKVQAERAINKTALLSVAGKAYDAVEGAIQELRLLRASVLPNARRAVEGIEDGYGQGRFTLLELLDVRATLIDALLREQEALRSYHIAIATIEGLVGRPFALTGGTR